MKLLKGLQNKVLLGSSMAVLALSISPAIAATTDTPFGACTGADDSGGAGKDCVTAIGHISASVVGTLSINEMRAISFGNFAVNNAGGDGKGLLVLDPTGVRHASTTGTDAFVLLNGADATGGPAGSTGSQETGSQSPGHYTVSAGAEHGATQVYISFAQADGTGIDACSPAGSAGGNYAANSGGAAYAGTHGTCDNYHPGSAVTLTGPAGNTFTVDQFVFNESGSDVYGHYIDNATNTGPGSPTPFLPGSSSGTGHDNGAATANTVGDIDVVVGATLHTVAGPAYTPGKYTGTFDVMVSY